LIFSKKFRPIVHNRCIYDIEEQRQGKGAGVKAYKEGSGDSEKPAG
jgi:hypothetical protein